MLRALVLGDEAQKRQATQRSMDASCVEAFPVREWQLQSRGRVVRRAITPCTPANGCDRIDSRKRSTPAAVDLRTFRAMAELCRLFRRPSAASGEHRPGSPFPLCSYTDPKEPECYCTTCSR